MTGQPETQEEFAEANRRANKSMNDNVPEDIKNHPLTKDSLKDDDTEEKSDDEKLAELREAKERGDFDELEEIAEENEQAPVWEASTVRNKNDDTEMAVTEDGETTTYSREEWNARRDTNVRTWERLERNGGMYVRVAHWFNDADVNKVQNGRGFFGHKVGETEKAFQFEVGVDSTHTAESETVWVPKKAVWVCELR